MVFLLESHHMLNSTKNRFEEDKRIHELRNIERLWEVWVWAKRLEGTNPGLIHVGNRKHICMGSLGLGQKAQAVYLVVQ